jgi:GNAT superfamily N-acetyltransferase
MSQMIAVSTPSTLNTLRQSARDLLNEFDAADALTSFYTLHYDANRTTLFVHRDSDQQVDGFLVRCQTGFDLFRPLVSLRLRGDAAAAPLIDEALQPGRPYLLILPAHLAERVSPHVALTDSSRNRVYRLDARRYKPEINVMVVTSTDKQNNPRAEIRVGGQVAASAGVNWRSPIFAEVFTHVLPEFRGRGWGKSVVNAVAGALLKMQVTPLYSAAEDNDTSQSVAERVGFVDTGAREIMSQATRPS